MSSETAWLKEALLLAEQAAAQDEVPVGALVVHDNLIVGRGFNRREMDQNPIAHAEILALLDASKKLESWRLRGCTLIVTLEPCPMCLAACQQARVDQVIYGAHDPKGGALSLGYPIHQDERMNHRFDVHFREDKECGKILTRFFEKKRKRASS